MPETALLNAALSIAASTAWMKFAGAGGRNGAPQPAEQLAVAFVAGIVMTLPAAGLEDAASGRHGTEAAGFMAIAAAAEEACKMGAAMAAAFMLRGKGARTALAMSASLGFAAAENFAYLTRFGTWAILIRGPLSTLTHLALGLVWGRALELRGRGPAPALAALALASGLHAAYNAAIRESWLAAAPAAALSVWWIWLGYPRTEKEAEQA